MFLSGITKWFARRGRPAPSKCRPATKLGVENLEDRTVPTTLYLDFGKLAELDAYYRDFTLGSPPAYLDADRNNVVNADDALIQAISITNRVAAVFNSIGIKATADVTALLAKGDAGQPGTGKGKITLPGPSTNRFTIDIGGTRPPNAPGDALGSAVQAPVKMNSASAGKVFSTSIRGLFSGTPSSAGKDYRAAVVTVAVHELGHLLGLGHPVGKNHPLYAMDGLKVPVDEKQATFPNAKIKVWLVRLDANGNPVDFKGDQNPFNELKASLQGQPLYRG